MKKYAAVLMLAAVLSACGDDKVITGPAGPTGTTGATGPQGPAGPPGITKYDTIRITDTVRIAVPTPSLVRDTVYITLQPRPLTGTCERLDPNNSIPEHWKHHSFPLDSFRLLCTRVL